MYLTDGPPCVHARPSTVLTSVGMRLSKLDWAADSPELSYLATAVPLVTLAMAATAPFALFRRLPSSTSSSSSVSHGASSRSQAAAGDWSGPMLPAEVRRFSYLIPRLVSLSWVE